MTELGEERWETGLASLAGRELLELLRRLERGAEYVRGVRPWDGPGDPTSAQRHATAAELSELAIPVVLELRRRLA